MHLCTLCCSLLLPLFSSLKPTSIFHISISNNRGETGARMQRTMLSRKCVGFRVRTILYVCIVYVFPTIFFLEISQYHQLHLLQTFLSKYIERETQHCIAKFAL